jgi:DNA-binding NarL/FixJ family response regulator
MARICCLAGIDRAKFTMLSDVLKSVAGGKRAISSEVDVRQLGTIAPELLIADLDHLTVDPLERLRQIRFVLRSCVISIYSGDSHQAWGRACHLAGANAMLSKLSSPTELRAGVKEALFSGCFTDPRFAA